MVMQFIKRINSNFHFNYYRSFKFMNSFVSQCLTLILKVIQLDFIIAGMSSVRHLNSSKENQKSIFGIYFCSRCQNVMTPYKAQGPNLEFRCQSCGLQEIDFNTRYGENCLLYSKELQVGSKKYTPDLATILDPTMPSVEAECPECGYDRAIYSLTPDEGETKIIVKMICASRTGTTAKCGHIWELDECDELQQTRVITQQMRQQFNE